MSQSCDLPIVRIGQPPDVETDCSKEAAARKIYAEVGPATVEINHDFITGSGFFIGDGSRIVTNAHVVNGATDLLDITTIDHKQYKARIESLDDINDLAVLHLEDGAKGTTALKIGDPDALKKDEPVYALGHPLGKSDTYISPGTFYEKGAFDKVFASKDPADEDWQLFLKLTKSNNPATAADAQSVIKSTRVEALTQTEPGNSGGPIVNDRNEVVAVTQFGSMSKEYHKYTWGVSSDQINTLLNSKPKFQFDYEKVSEARKSPITTGILTTAAIGLTAGLPRVGGSFLGAISALDMAFMASGETKPRQDSSDKLYHALEQASDAGMVVGALTSWFPRLRTVALASYGIGLAAMTIQDFVPHDIALVGIKRTANPQDKRRPLFWDGFNTEQ